jgi:hypothetical protein
MIKFSVTYFTKVTRKIAERVDENAEKLISGYLMEIKNNLWQCL